MSSTMFDPDDWEDGVFRVHESTVIQPLHTYTISRHWESDGPDMGMVVGLVATAGAVIIIGLLCYCCCCRSSTSGRVIAPPAPLREPGRAPAPYPQQQYTVAAYPATVVTSYPVADAAPYLTPAPAPYPTQASYPTISPYPVGAAAPGPAASPYGHAPSAPDPQAFFGIAPPGWTPQACPPPYDQVMHQNETKQPPYNPHY